MKNFTYLLFFILFIISCNTLNQGNVNDSKKENFEKPVITNFDITDYGLDGSCYYVSETGDDNNNGLSTSTPFKTIQRAVDITAPGDIVFVMNGTYKNINDYHVAFFTQQHSGTADHWIMLTNYPDHKPKIEFNGWGGIEAGGADYIIINGFTVEGNTDNITFEYAMEQMNNLDISATTGAGITAIYYFDDPTEKTHHVIITNNEVYNCCGNGIAAVNVDYLTIKNNIVHHNAFYAPYAGSGISTWENWSSDNYTGYKMFIQNNIAYCNYNYIPFYYSAEDPEDRIVTDGNGIIIDDTRNMQDHGQQLGDYNGKTLVQNNICFYNGARGIHVYLSRNTDVINNTCYKNNQCPDTLADNNYGDISVVDSMDINVYNNIIYTEPGQYANFTWQIDNVNFDYNLIYNTTNYMHTGPNDVFADPLFINSPAGYDNPLPFDFHISNNSSAINTGTHILSPDFDFDYNPRPYGLGYDIGAYEYNN